MCIFHNSHSNRGYLEEFCAVYNRLGLQRGHHLIGPFLWQQPLVSGMSGMHVQPQEDLAGRPIQETVECVVHDACCATEVLIEV